MCQLSPSGTLRGDGDMNSDQFTLTIKDERKHPASLDRRVRIALKRMLRGLGLRVTGIKPSNTSEATEDQAG